ncbi:MAG TPA: heavy-metal-associated domain-containing protein [Anaerolineae bacterium]|nr:cation transporter [Anaerolineae bacterium]MCB0226688.1 cation transporter [Anaerolineae bacterium]MCB9109348.1 cation transporter [Anaerolineales bacterium]HRV94717.1 heavy-metal-associated domain-containing protein [Anaerolineae bacterium]
MRTINWIAPTYHCGNCLIKIKRVLAEIDGVRLVSSDQGRQRLTIEAAGPEVIAYTKRRLAGAGFPVQPE